MILNWDDLFFNPQPVANAAPNPWAASLVPAAALAPAQPAPAPELPAWGAPPLLSPPTAVPKADYDPFKAFGTSPAPVQKPVEKGVFGDSFGIMTPDDQQAWLTDQFKRHEEGTRHIAALEKQLAGAASPYQARALNRMLDAQRQALPDLARLTRMKEGLEPLPGKTGLRSAAENAPRGFADAVLGVPEFAGIVKGYLSDHDVDDDNLLKWAQGAKESVRGVFPGDPVRQNDFDQQLAAGLGQIASFYGTGALASLAKAGPKVMGAIVATQGAAGSGSQGFEEATQKLVAARDEARRTGEQATVDELDRILQTFGYAAVGTTEALPIMNNLVRGGGRAMGALEGAVEEGVQEGTSQFAQNLIAKGTTDPTRDIGQGVAEGIAIGGILGGGMGAATAGPAAPRAPEMTVEPPYEWPADQPLSFIDLIPGEGYTEVTPATALPAPAVALPAAPAETPVTPSEPVPGVPGAPAMAEGAAAMRPLTGFYSVAERAAEALPDQKMTPEQMLGTLRNAPGVKQAELDWLGVEEFLASGPKTKQELVDHIRANQAVLVEDTRQLPPEAAKLEEERLGLEAEFKAMAINPLTPEQFADLRDRHMRNLEARAAVNSQLLHSEEVPKFMGRGMTGGTNYRELLLQMPALEGKYRSPHFDAQELAHIRLDDRTGPNGERILNIVELQSDLHQKGRRSGYKGTPEQIAKIQAEFDEKLEKLMYARQNGLSEEEIGALVKEVGALRDKQYRMEGVSSVPNAPFKGSGWEELALKKVLHLAAEQGYDAVSWARPDQTTGGADRMRTFYDVKLPQLVNKLTKKWGGKVEEGQLSGSYKDNNTFSGTQTNNMVRITDAMRASVLEGQPLHAQAPEAAQEAVDTSAYDIAAPIKESPPIKLPDSLSADDILRYGEQFTRAGRAIQLPPSLVEPMMDMLAANPELIPTTAAVLTRIEPAGFNAAGKALIRTVFTDTNGEQETFLDEWEKVKSLQAFFHPRTGGLYFLTLDPAETGRDRLTAKLWHEGFHALRGQGLIPPADFDRLFAHADNLRVLDLDYNDFARATKDPNVDLYEDGVTIRELYADLYGGRPNAEELLAQEAVTHMLELYVHGVLPATGLAAVQDVIDNIASGRYAEPAGGDGTTLNAPVTEVVPDERRNPGTASQADEAVARAPGSGAGAESGARGARSAVAEGAASWNPLKGLLGGGAPDTHAKAENAVKGTAGASYFKDAADQAFSEGFLPDSLDYYDFMTGMFNNWLDPQDPHDAPALKALTPVMAAFKKKYAELKAQEVQENTDWEESAAFFGVPVEDGSSWEPLEEAPLQVKPWMPTIEDALKEASHLSVEALALFNKAIDNAEATLGEGATNDGIKNYLQGYMAEYIKQAKKGNIPNAPAAWDLDQIELITKGLVLPLEELQKVAIAQSAPPTSPAAEAAKAEPMSFWEVEQQYKDKLSPIAKTTIDIAKQDAIDAKVGDASTLAYKQHVAQFINKTLQAPGSQEAFTDNEYAKLKSFAEDILASHVEAQKKSAEPSAITQASNLIQGAQGAKVWSKQLFDWASYYKLDLDKDVPTPEQLKSLGLALGKAASESQLPAADKADLAAAEAVLKGNVQPATKKADNAWTWNEAKAYAAQHSGIALAMLEDTLSNYEEYTGQEDTVDSPNWKSNMADLLDGLAENGAEASDPSLGDQQAKAAEVLKHLAAAFRGEVPKPAAPAPTPKKNIPWPDKFVDAEDAVKFVSANLSDDVNTLWRTAWNNALTSSGATGSGVGQNPKFKNALAAELAAQADILDKLAEDLKHPDDATTIKHLRSMAKRLETPVVEKLKVALPEGLGFDDLIPAPQRDYTFVSNAGGGSKPKEIWQDAEGNKYLFKPVPAKDEFVAYGEVAGGHIARLVNPHAPRIWLQQLNGRTGSMQEMLPNNGDLGRAKLQDLTVDEISAIMKEHVVDWLISNHDGHRKQFLWTQNGIVGIDKGQAFKYFGKDRLATDYHPNEVYGEQPPIYNELWKAFSEGKLSNYTESLLGETGERIKTLKTAVQTLETQLRALREKSGKLDEDLTADRVLIVSQTRDVMDNLDQHYLITANDIDLDFKKIKAAHRDKIEESSYAGADQVFEDPKLKAFRKTLLSELPDLFSALSRAQTHPKAKVVFARIAEAMSKADGALPEYDYAQEVELAVRTALNNEKGGFLGLGGTKLSNEELGQNIGLAYVAHTFAYRASWSVNEAVRDNIVYAPLGNHSVGTDILDRFKNRLQETMTEFSVQIMKGDPRKAEIKAVNDQIFTLEGQRSTVTEELQGVEETIDDTLYKPVNAAIHALQNKLSDNDFLAIIRPYAEKRFKGREAGFNAFMDYALQRKRNLGEKFHRFFLSLDAARRRAQVGMKQIGISLQREMHANTAEDVKEFATLSPREFSALRAYTGGVYGNINRPLRQPALIREGLSQPILTRSKAWMHSASVTELLDAGLRKLPAYTGLAYRGMSLYGDDLTQLKPGKIWRAPHVLSTSSEKSSSFSGNVRMVINSRSGRDISRLSQSPSENEVLFPSDAPFLITAVELKDSTYHVYMEEIPAIDFNDLDAKL